MAIRMTPASFMPANVALYSITSSAMMIVVNGVFIVKSKCGIEEIEEIDVVY